MTNSTNLIYETNKILCRTGLTFEGNFFHLVLNLATQLLRESVHTSLALFHQNQHAGDDILPAFGYVS